MSYNLVIFDMDGTLIDSSRLLANAINHVRCQLHLPPMPQDTILSHVNAPHIDPAKYFYEVDRFEPIHEQWFSEYYSAHHATELQLYDGIRSLLIHLHDRGTTIAVATNAYRVSALESLEHLGIAPLFDAVVCQDDVPHPKPAPDMLYRILGAFHTPKGSAVFVGDGPRDEEAAIAAGIDFIMVDWGYTEHKAEKKVVRSVEELWKKLEGKSKNYQE